MFCCYASFDDLVFDIGRMSRDTPIASLLLTWRKLCIELNQIVMVLLTLPFWKRVKSPLMNPAYPSNTPATVAASPYPFSAAYPQRKVTFAKSTHTSQSASDCLSSPQSRYMHHPRRSPVLLTTTPPAHCYTCTRPDLKHCARHLGEIAGLAKNHHHHHRPATRQYTS